MKKVFEERINKELNNLFNITKELYENPEIGLNEYNSSKLLVEYLNKQGFETTYPYIMDTAFVAKFKSSKTGPKLAYLCEYDALPDVGHGCGHNLICTMSVAAGIALKDEVEKYGGELHIIGTPAEETVGGKVIMAKEHAFDDLDVAMMLHPGTKNNVGEACCAIIPVKFDFYGTSAHACNPYNGASALDAAVTTYQGINMLRQFVKQPSTFIHGIFKDGGSAANIIPSHASLEYYFRAATLEYCKEIEAKAKNIAESSAKMNNCSVEYSYFEGIYDDLKINYTLADALKEAYCEVGLTDVGDVVKLPAGSSDVGAVSKITPTIHGYIKIAEAYINGHSKEMADTTVSDSGRFAILNGGTALAILGYKYLTDKIFQEKVKEEFNKN